MQRVNTQGHVDNRFVHEDVATNQPPTNMSADWLNWVQEELARFVELAGLTLDEGDSEQLHKALLNLITDSLATDDSNKIASAKAARLLKNLVDGKAHASHTHDNRYFRENEFTTSAGANTPVKRDSSADIHARLFRSSYSEQSNSPGSNADIAFRNSTSDNYVRFATKNAMRHYFKTGGWDIGSYRLVLDTDTTNNAGYPTASSPGSGSWAARGSYNFEDRNSSINSNRDDETYYRENAYTITLWEKVG